MARQEERRKENSTRVQQGRCMMCDQITKASFGNALWRPCPKCGGVLRPIEPAMNNAERFRIEQQAEQRMERLAGIR